MLDIRKSLGLNNLWQPGGPKPLMLSDLGNPLNKLELARKVKLSKITIEILN